jgi:anti-sigma B factor antagonist
MTIPIQVIQPHGILNGVQAKELREQVGELAAAGNTVVLLDLADVNFMDSSGLVGLVAALKILRTAGGNLYLCSIAEPVKNLFALTRMDRVFEIFRDRKQFITTVLD